MALHHAMTSRNDSTPELWNAEILNHISPHRIANGLTEIPLSSLATKRRVHLPGDDFETIEMRYRMRIRSSSPLEHLKAFALVFAAGIVTALSWVSLVSISKRGRVP